MLFVQAAAPTGWTKQTTVNDAAIRVVSGETGGKTGGSVAFSAAFVAGKSITLSGNVGATTLSSAMLPDHRHNKLDAGDFHDAGSGGGLVMSQPQKDTGAKYYSKIHTLGGSGGFLGGCGNGSHTHSLSGTATVDLSVKYIDVILCKKA